jgi:hydroxymethylglutaryl-CoA lyase
VATEDLAYLMHSMGIATGMDFGRLLALRERLATWLQGETLHGSLWRAGLPRTMLPSGTAPATAACGPVATRPA